MAPPPAKQKRNDAKKGSQCFAINCTNYKNRFSKQRGISFHKFPDKTTQTELYQQWVRNCGRTVLPSQHARVCSVHFAKSMVNSTMKHTVLCEGAVPTLFQLPDHLKGGAAEPCGHLGRLSPPSDCGSSVPITRMVRCAAYNCQSEKNKPTREKGITFHRFPNKEKDNKRYREWVRNLRWKNWTPSLHSVVCSNHFTAESFDRTGQTVRLRAFAVPTIFTFPSHLCKKQNERKPPIRRGLSEDLESDNVAVSFPSLSSTTTFLKQSLQKISAIPDPLSDPLSVTPDPWSSLTDTSAVHIFGHFSETKQDDNCEELKPRAKNMQLSTKRKIGKPAHRWYSSISEEHSYALTFIFEDDDELESERDTGMEIWIKDEPIENEHETSMEIEIKDEPVEFEEPYHITEEASDLQLRQLP